MGASSLLKLLERDQLVVVERDLHVSCRVCDVNDISDGHRIGAGLSVPEFRSGAQSGGVGSHGQSDLIRIGVRPPNGATDPEALLAVVRGGRHEVLFPPCDAAGVLNPGGAAERVRGIIPLETLVLHGLLVQADGERGALSEVPVAPLVVVNVNDLSLSRRLGLGPNNELESLPGGVLRVNWCTGDCPATVALGRPEGALSEVTSLSLFASKVQDTVNTAQVRQSVLVVSSARVLFELLERDHLVVFERDAHVSQRVPHIDPD